LFSTSGGLNDFFIFCLISIFGSRPIDVSGRRRHLLPVEAVDVACGCRRSRVPDRGKVFPREL
jgi:hypothetical protein